MRRGPVKKSARAQWWERCGSPRAAFERAVVELTLRERSTKTILRGVESILAQWGAMLPEWDRDMLGRQRIALLAQLDGIDDVDLQLAVNEYRGGPAGPWPTVEELKERGLWVARCRDSHELRARQD